MKSTTTRLLLVATLSSFLTACSDSSPSEQSTSGQSATPAAKSELSTAATAAAKEVAGAAKAEAADLFANLGEKLASVSKGDATLKDIGADLQKSVQSLGTSLQDNPALQTQLNTAVQSLLGSKDVDALKGFDQLGSAALTPSQTALVKEVYNLGAAYVTQKNFASLEGAQTDVAQLVGALRKGELTSAVPPLQKIYQNASLTPAQKDLVSSLADKYAPALKSAAGKISGGLDQLKKVGQ